MNPDITIPTQRPNISNAPRWVRSKLSRVTRLFVLLIVILVALISTTFLERHSQIALLKGFLVFVLALIPGWLYLQFIDSKATRLYDEYVLNLFRLKIDRLENLPKPPAGSSYWQSWLDARKAHSFSDDLSNNVYLKKFEAVYGEAAIRAPHRSESDVAAPEDEDQGIGKTIRTERFSPVILATALLALGWVAFLGPELYRNLPLFTPGTFSEFPAVPVEPLRLGFLGAYTFILQSFVRRYYASDLKTRAFVGAILRVVLVAGLVIVVHPIWEYNNWPAELEGVFAFAVGYFPDFALRLIKTKALAAADIALSRKSSHNDDEDRFPLKELDGLNLWYEARFVEEGVENMQNLSTTSIVDLMVSTRTPVARLVDWMDQSILYLRVTNKKDRDRLRRVGIRTATDLIRVLDCSKSEHPYLHKGLVDFTATGDGGGALNLEGIRVALEGDVSLIHVRHFRAHDWLETPPSCGPSSSAPVQ